MSNAGQTERVKMDGRAVNQFRAALLRWYEQYRRPLPWRAAPGQVADAYAVLVSEAMLQQTQVATVIDYFHRFMEAFPTIRSLAAAEEVHVLRLWQGLGYYRRARHLHAAAKMIVTDFGGVVPETVPQLMQLPGIGRYTAGAIASIAYDTPAAVVDGNVMRVLARWLGEVGAVDEPGVNRRLWAAAERLVPKARAGDHNQAMMELGALICTKASPRCEACVVAKRCAARAAGNAAALPRKRARKKPMAVVHHILAIQRRGRFLFEQRPETGLWPNMWQLPTTEDAFHSGATAELTCWTRDRFGLTLGTLTTIDTFAHQTTHRSITFHLHRVDAAGGRLKRHVAQWRSLTDAAGNLPLSNPQRRAVSLLTAAGR